MDPYGGYGGDHHGYNGPIHGQHPGGAYGRGPPLEYRPTREDLDESSDDDIIQGMGGLNCGVTVRLPHEGGYETGIPRGRALRRYRAPAVVSTRIPEGSIPPYLDAREVYVFPMREVRVNVRVDAHGQPGNTFSAVVPSKTTIEELIARLLPSTGGLRRRGTVEVRSSNGHRRVLEGREKIEDIKRTFPSSSKLVISDSSGRGHGRRSRGYHM
ncbi:MAG: hypothetical protein M1836_003090 [Candelina mexicana]|nr:MAG: hypothetical protein M1836_003090 [Candelina mexicana]